MLGYDYDDYFDSFFKFKDSLLEKTNGILRTFNLGDYISSVEDYQTIGKWPSEPLKYFSRLATLTKKLPKNGKIKKRFYQEEEFIYL